MGRIAPRQRKRLPFYHPLLKMWMASRKPTARDAQQEEDMVPEGTTSRGKSLVNKFWHAADDWRLMDPLPPAHRRGIILALVIVLLAFLWPAPQPETTPARPVQQNGGTDVPLQADIYENTNSTNQQNPAQTQDTATPSNTERTPPPAQPENDSRGEWRNYQVTSGQTLAQLFRDNNLQVNDVFAMARVEGDDKPLSNLHTGQNVKIRQNSNGVVTGLTVETDNGPILFTRQPDGSFIRAQ